MTALDIIGSEAKVIVSIMPNSFGSVSLDTKNGKITYSAKSDHYIQQGQLVKIIDLKDSVVFVTDDPRYFLHKPSS